MNLKTRLQEDLKQAMRENAPVRKAALRLTLAAIKNAEIEKRGELDDAGVLAVLHTEVKRRRDTIAELEKTDRADLLAAEQAELACLLEYLPRQMSRDEIIAAAREVIAQVGASRPAQTGEVMKRLMPQLKGQADGKLVNQIVQELLSGK